MSQGALQRNRGMMFMKNFECIEKSRVVDVILPLVIVLLSPCFMSICAQGNTSLSDSLTHDARQVLDRLIEDGLEEADEWWVLPILQGEPADIGGVLDHFGSPNRRIIGQSTAEARAWLQKYNLNIPAVESAFNQLDASGIEVTHHYLWLAILRGTIDELLSLRQCRQNFVNNLHESTYQFQSADSPERFVAGELSMADLMLDVQGVTEVFVGEAHSLEELLDHVEAFFETMLDEEIDWDIIVTDAAFSITANGSSYEISFDKVRDVDRVQKRSGKLIYSETTFLDYGFYRSLLQTAAQIASDHGSDYSIGLYRPARYHGVWTYLNNEIEYWTPFPEWSNEHQRFGCIQMEISSVGKSLSRNSICGGKKGCVLTL